jgi:hypothetical protein
MPVPVALLDQESCTFSLHIRNRNGSINPRTLRQKKKGKRRTSSGGSRVSSPGSSSRHVAQTASTRSPLIFFPDSFPVAVLAKIPLLPAPIFHLWLRPGGSHSLCLCRPKCRPTSLLPELARMLTAWSSPASTLGSPRWCGRRAEPATRDQVAAAFSTSAVG